MLFLGYCLESLCSERRNNYLFWSCSQSVYEVVSIFYDQFPFPISLSPFHLFNMLSIPGNSHMSLSGGDVCIWDASRVQSQKD